MTLEQMVNKERRARVRFAIGLHKKAIRKKQIREAILITILGIGFVAVLLIGTWLSPYVMPK